MYIYVAATISTSNSHLNYSKNGKSFSDFELVLFLAAFIIKRKKGPAPKNGVFVVLAYPYCVAHMQAKL